MIIQGFAFWDEFLPYSSLCSLALSTVALPTNGYWTEQDVNFLLEKPRRSPTIFPRNFTRKRRQNDTGHFLYSSETGPADFCPLLQGVARAGQGGSGPTWPQDEPKRVPFQRQGAGHVCSLYAQVYYLPQWKTAGFSALPECVDLEVHFVSFWGPRTGLTPLLGTEVNFITMDNTDEMLWRTQVPEQTDPSSNSDLITNQLCILEQTA